MQQLNNLLIIIIILCVCVWELAGCDAKIKISLKKNFQASPVQFLPTLPSRSIVDLVTLSKSLKDCGENSNGTSSQ